MSGLISCHDGRQYNVVKDDLKYVGFLAEDWEIIG